jgi:hypothetical protein
VIDGQPSSTTSAARQPRTARFSPLSGPVRFAAPVLVLGACLVAPLLSATPASGSSQTQSLQSEAAQLSQQLIREQLQVDFLEHQDELDTLQVKQDNAAVAAVRAQVTKDEDRVHADHVRLSAEAVSAYVNAGASSLDPALQLFSDARNTLTSRSEYESVVIGNTEATLAELHTDQVDLQATEATLVLRTKQDEASQGAAAASTAAAQQVADQLAAKQALVTGQLAVAIAADRNAQAAQAVTARVLAGGAVGDPALPPFLQCVVQVESSGNYQAVSPDGQYMGAFQFSQSTWNEAAQLAGLPQLIGVPPNQASKADQDTLAIALYNADGEQPWDDGCRS